MNDKATENRCSAAWDSVGNRIPRSEDTEGATALGHRIKKYLAGLGG